jgi:hypothetical protein
MGLNSSDILLVQPRDDDVEVVNGTLQKTCVEFPCFGVTTNHHSSSQRCLQIQLNKDGTRMKTVPIICKTIHCITGGDVYKQNIILDSRSKCKRNINLSLNLRKGILTLP